jgi:putative copper export protein
MEPDRLAIILRALIYAGSIAATGGVLFALSFPKAAPLIESALKRQILIGCWLILFVEPLRYVTFQLAAAEGDWSAAFAPGLRWMAFETSFGRAAAVRVLAAAVMIAASQRWRGVSVAAAFAVIASFALEGHTVSGGSRFLLGALLVLHFAAISWWIGALYPLLVVLRHTPSEVAAATIGTFGRRAVWIVLALLSAGALLLISLAGVELDPGNEYQQGSRAS